MEDRLPQVKQAIVGVNRDLYNSLELGKKNLSAETIIIVYADKTAEILDASQFEENKKLYIMEGLNKAIEKAIENPKNYKTLYSDDKNFEKIYAKAVKQLEKQEHAEDYDKDNSKITKIAALTGLGALVIAGLTVGAYSLGKKNNDKDNGNSNEFNQEQEANNLQLVPDMTGKDISFYSENALETSQKPLMLNINQWLAQNGTETWGKVSLTEEQMKEYGFVDSECVFGFTAEDAYSLALRFGHYTKDEYVTLTGGNNMDTVAVMDDAHSMSNGALANIISYYVCSDTCDLNIEQIINFTDEEQAKINEIEGMLTEYKALDKEEGKEKEAEEKMKEIKSWLNNYANSNNYEQDNAKSYILRTFLPACSAISEMHQYQDTITLSLYDTEKDEYINKEIKTALFDELMMRNLVLGFNETGSMGAFDSEAFLEENNISNTRYDLLNTDVARSIADQSCSSQIENLNQANEYISTLRNENTTAEAAYMGSLRVDLNKEDSIGNQVVEQMDNVNTTYDELTYGTYDYEILLEMLNTYLKDNSIYPRNINYFRSAKMSEIAIEYKNTHGVTQGNKGDYVPTEEIKENVKVTEKDLNSSTAIIVDENGKEVSKDQAMASAREEDAKKSTDYDYAASTPEESKKADEQASQDAAARAQFLQNVYNATFNYYAGETVVATSTGYDSSWATSSDAAVLNYHNLAKAHGLKYKSDKAQNGTIIENGSTNSIPENAEIYDTPQEPVSSIDNTTSEENTNSDEGISNVPPEGYAPVVDESNIASYSLEDISDEEWEQLIIPTEDVTETSEELTGPTK